jgi:hypothetical protein
MDICVIEHSLMRTWKEIVWAYDYTKKKELFEKKQVTCSQFAVVSILMYLVMGEDWTYNMAENFRVLSYGPRNKRPGIGILKHHSNLGSLLEEMKKDGLVIGRRDDMEVRERHYYRLNPDVIRSPIPGSAYSKSDGSFFEIPLELINDFMDHVRIKDQNRDVKTVKDSANTGKKINKRQDEQRKIRKENAKREREFREERNEQRKKIIAASNSIVKFDFFTFIVFIEGIAKIIAEESNDGQMKRFADMMFKYMLVFRERSRFLDPLFVEDNLNREKQYRAILSDINQKFKLK